MFKKVLFLIGLLFMFHGCASNKSAVNVDIKEHMVESKKLSVMMRELDMVVYERLKSELDKDNLRRRYAMHLADTIKNLAYKIEHVSPESLGEKVTEQDAEIYRKYSHELYVNAQEIYDVAQNYELEKLSGKIDNIQRVCNSCHTQFRDK